MWRLPAAARRALHPRQAHARSCLLPVNALSAVGQRRYVSESGKGEPRLVKRKVALVAGYLGTGYHGVQLNKDVETIENELRKAILGVGAMRESNFEDLAKIDWSRSSRTDKGVHAGCIVFSGKMLIDEAGTVDPTTGRINALTDSLNAVLPSTIRIFSSTRVNKRFSARKNCVLREYEYFMPLSFLESSARAANSGDEWDSTAAVDAFCQSLRRYEGIHDFHNFTKSRSFFYRQHATQERGRADKGATMRFENKASEIGSSMAQFEDFSADVPSMESEDQTAEDASSESATHRKQLPRHRRAIYSCSGSLITDFYGEPYIRVHIVGQAFLLHQIRCMIGGALAVATKGMSSSLFDAAIETNRIVRIPIAPAEGLVLLSSSFGGKLHSVSLFEDFNTQLASERQEVSHRVLLSKKEDSVMQSFREDVIYNEVKRAWGEVAENERWRAYLERTYEVNGAIADAELASLLEELKLAKQNKSERQHTFLEHSRTTAIEEKRPRGVLPRQFTTKLCVRYTIAPGIFTADLRRGITRHLRLGNIPLDADEEQIFEFVDKHGVQQIAEDGRRFRLGLDRNASSSGSATPLSN